MSPLLPLSLLTTLLLAACAGPPERPRGIFDLSNGPEPGGHAAPASLGDAPRTGSGRFGSIGPGSPNPGSAGVGAGGIGGAIGAPGGS
jgi:hypothetical protein